MLWMFQHNKRYIFIFLYVLYINAYAIHALITYIDTGKMCKYIVYYLYRIWLKFAMWFRYLNLCSSNSEICYNIFRFYCRSRTLKNCLFIYDIIIISNPVCICLDILLLCVRRNCQSHMNNINFCNNFGFWICYLWYRFI